MPLRQRNGDVPRDSGGELAPAWQIRLMLDIVERTEPMKQFYMKATGGPDLSDFVKSQAADAAMAMARLNQAHSVAEVIRDIELEHAANDLPLQRRLEHVRDWLAAEKPAARARARKLRHFRKERQRQGVSDAVMDEFSKQVEASQLDAVKLLQREASPRKLVKRLRKAIAAARRRRLTLQAAKTAIAFLVFSLAFDQIQKAAEEKGGPKIEELFRTAPTPTTIAVWLLAAVALFALDRWLLGPFLEGWADRKMIRSGERGVIEYCIGRLALEYELRTAEHELHKLDELKKALPANA